MPEVGKLLPFRRVVPAPQERYTSCVPLVAFDAAASTWSDLQQAVAEPDDPDAEWVTWDARTRFSKGMFVARVRGRSMEPLIPDGAFCLFREVSLPSSPERAVLVRHGGVTDPDTGGQYTVKLYREGKGPDGDKRIILQPVNAEFAPIVIAGPDIGNVRVFAELVEVIGD
jgi:phage repressor protein C with HTH and peptisase S24 domain